MMGAIESKKLYIITKPKNSPKKLTIGGIPSLAMIAKNHIKENFGKEFNNPLIKSIFRECLIP